jgi:hypothetical protein
MSLIISIFDHLGTTFDESVSDYFTDMIHPKADPIQRENKFDIASTNLQPVPTPQETRNDGEKPDSQGFGSTRRQPPDFWNGMVFAQ